jgi:predicted regulator of Ras-like GTPase activity (Roadblock/LC7/MglB family)
LKQRRADRVRAEVKSPLGVGVFGLASGITRGVGWTPPPRAAPMPAGRNSQVSREPRSMVRGNWALFEEDFFSITTILQSLLRSAGARSAMLIDKTGQLINTVGEPPRFDLTSFSSLAAADFAANAQLAEMVGEEDFATLVHQGKNGSLYLSMISNRVILVVLFDRKTSLGLVRLKARRASEELMAVLSKVFDKLQYRNEELTLPALGEDFAAEADSTIDSLFQD